MGSMVTVNEAARLLSVSERRVQAIAEAGGLQGRRLDARTWVFDSSDVRLLERTMRRHPGRPLTQGAAWRLIDDIEHNGLPGTDHDGLRRRLRSRASHRYLFVHPSVLARQRRNPPPDIVLGGSDAAEEHEVPVGAPEATMHAYIGAGRYDAFSEAAGGPMTAPPDGANLIVHLLEDWPFRSEQRHTPLFVAWLDMADEDQRGADLVERRLLTRR